MTPDLYILAGGASRRFGSDKARALRHGKPLVVGVAEALATAVGQTAVVASRDGQYDDLGLHTIGDEVPSLGPLGGLVTALSDLAGRGGEWMLLAACDLIDPDPQWVSRLSRAAAPDRPSVFRGAGGWEPVFGLYPASLLDGARRSLQGDDRSMQALLDREEAVAVPVPAAYRHVTTSGDLTD